MPGAVVTVGDISCTFFKTPCDDHKAEYSPTQFIQPSCFTSVMRGGVEIFKVLLTDYGECAVRDDGAIIFVGGNTASTVEVRFNSADWGKFGAKLFANSPSKVSYDGTADHPAIITFSKPDTPPISIDHEPN